MIARQVTIMDSLNLLVKNHILKPIRFCFRQLGFELINTQRLQKYQSAHPTAYLFSKLAQEQKVYVAEYLAYSNSQYSQDIFVVSLEPLIKNKFFVEFGATNGVLRSNTYLLERIGWEGILVEPCKHWHEELHAARSSTIDIRCVGPYSGLLVNFLEAKDPELSSIESYSQSGDWASLDRIKGAKRYTVETISLNDLLDFHQAPRNIGYISIDTEGSEVAILERFNFQKWDVSIFTVESNRRKLDRERLDNLMKENGYVKVYSDISECDEWYISGKLLA